MKDKLGEEIMTKLVGLRGKTYSYLIDDDSKDKTAKDTKKCIIKRKLKFKSYKNYLEATQLENKINHLEKNKFDIHSLKKDHKEFITNNKVISKTQQRFKSKKHNFFTEEINKITLNSIDDKLMQSIDSIETYAYGTSKDLVSEREEIKWKWKNIIKRYKID